MSRRQQGTCASVMNTTLPPNFGALGQVSARMPKKPKPCKAERRSLSKKYVNMRDWYLTFHSFIFISHKLSIFDYRPLVSKLPTSSFSLPATSYSQPATAAPPPPPQPYDKFSPPIFHASPVKMISVPLHPATCYQLRAAAPLSAISPPQSAAQPPTVVLGEVLGNFEAQKNSE